MRCLVICQLRFQHESLIALIALKLPFVGRQMLLHVNAKKDFAFAVLTANRTPVSMDKQRQLDLHLEGGAGERGGGRNRMIGRPT